ncbi:hypothetical protein Syun_020976 [Stephania yunnanensis]|uniref:Uncharacterized protein n=1 Tax=Stephania yunnanensis TaxID=152371 RepID=A0AAP0IET1_9MAGN
MTCLQASFTKQVGVLTPLNISSSYVGTSTKDKEKAWEFICLLSDKTNLPCISILFELHCCNIIGLGGFIIVF